MMNKITFTILCLGMACSAFAQSKLDLQSRMTLLQMRNTAIPTYNSRTRSFERPKSVQPNVMAMIEFTRVCQNVHILFFMHKAPTFSSQGFAVS